MVDKTEEFIKKAKEKFGDKYDYSKTVYVNKRTKIIVICKKHGESLQYPLTHLRGFGCQKCATEFGRSNTEEFIKKAKEIHGDVYDYSKTVYEVSGKKVIIICKKHGEFLQGANSHLCGQGCPKCCNENKKGRNYTTFEDFIERAKEIHGDVYDYSKVNYVNMITKISIICKIHGEFHQTPNAHTNGGQGCRKCWYDKIGLNKRQSEEEFIEKANKIHKYKYDYSNINYNMNKEKIGIICNEKNSNGKIHGIFYQRPDCHIHGNGCPKCSIENISSKPENEIYDFLINNGVENIRKNDRKLLKGKELDLIIEGKKIAIEFDGLYWHSDDKKPDNYHLSKSELCETVGYKLIHVFEDEFVYKKEIVLSRLLNILGKTKEKVYARKCEIKEVTYKDSECFLNENHIQGNCISKYRYGLYYNNELVSLMTFGSTRINLNSKKENGVFELLRFVNKKNTSVLGGASKLLKHFIKVVNPIKIISYSDNRWGNGNLYKKLNFKFVRKSKPNYFYVFKNKRINRFTYRKDVLVKQGFDKNKSEKEIMKERGINRIYDCGSTLFVLDIEKIN